MKRRTIIVLVMCIMGLTLLAFAEPKTKVDFCYYSKSDSDFARSNYSAENRLGSTDFFGFTKPDGTVIILEEDMKWTVDGAELDVITKRLEQFEQRKKNVNSHKEWVEQVTDALCGR